MNQCLAYRNKKIILKSIIFLINLGLVFNLIYRRSWDRKKIRRDCLISCLVIRIILGLVWIRLGLMGRILMIIGWIGWARKIIINRSINFITLVPYWRSHNNQIWYQKCKTNQHSKKLSVNAQNLNVYLCIVNVFQKGWSVIKNVHVINAEIIVISSKKDKKLGNQYLKEIRMLSQTSYKWLEGNRLN